MRKNRITNDDKKITNEFNIDKLVIVGAMNHMCIDAVTRAAVDLDYECHVTHDACATLDLEFNGVIVPAIQVHNALMAALVLIIVIWTIPIIY